MIVWRQVMTLQPGKGAQDILAIFKQMRTVAPTGGKFRIYTPRFGPAMAAIAFEAEFESLAELEAWEARFDSNETIAQLNKQLGQIIGPYSSEMWMLAEEGVST